MVVIGDAAHPVCNNSPSLPSSCQISNADGQSLTTFQMLPFGGQGSNQAIEDAGALGCVLKGLNSPEDVPARLAVFESVRIKRASVIQTLSKVRVGKEKDVEHEVARYIQPGAKVPGTFAERSAHAFGYNVLTATNEALVAAA